ncbi:MAG: DUF11 domain-containing protein, partial [Actinomycetota bacterium]|nr:DUF11 domain-containing protein [Actinomycetota bacterium]
LTLTGGQGFIDPDDNAFATDAWLVDTATDPFKYTLVSRNDAGMQSDRDSIAGPVSDDGSLVAFQSQSTNLGGSDRFDNIYVRDLTAGTTRLVSIPPGGGEFDVESKDPSMSADGLVVGFHNFRGAFVRDMRPTADLAVSMVDDPDPVVERNLVTYTVTVDNLGPGTTTNTTLVDTLPADPTFVSATTDDGTCVRDANDNSGGVLTCDLGTLATGQQATVTIVLEPRREGTIGNTATVDAAQADPATANNSAGQTTTVTPR